MKPLVFTLLAGLLLSSPSTARAEPKVIQIQAAADGKFPDAPEHAAALIQKIHGCDMNPWLLSESNHVRWRATKVTVIEDNLVLVNLSDGNGAESILFDRSPEGSWSILRRLPVGDWKPQAERRGDRLTVLRFSPES